MRFPSAIFVRPLGPPVNPPVGAVQNIAPDTGINATSNVTASISFSRSIAPDTGINATSSVTAALHRIAAISATISSTSSVTAATARFAAIKPDAISSTSSIAATVNKIAVISGASISSTTPVTATVSIKSSTKAITPDPVNSTSAITSSLTRFRAPVVSGVSSTSTVTASVVVLRTVSPSISSTSFLTVVLSGGTSQIQLLVDHRPQEGNTIGTFSSVASAMIGLVRRVSREPIPQAIGIDSLPPVAVTQKFDYILWDNSERVIVSRHGSQGEADHARLRRMRRSRQDLSVSTIDVP